ncbi:MAG TPA: hypothetical protein VEP90_04340 [Methylomirabilota bacterium]|nr:hypothetical protein [Methylomirabilota bacterium]
MKTQKETIMRGFGGAFTRGFGWGLGRSFASQATRRSSPRRKPLTDKQVYERKQVQGWINEAVLAYHEDGVAEPSFDDIYRYVKKYFNYKLTR